MKLEELKAIKKFLKKSLEEEKHMFDLVHQDIVNDFYNSYDFKQNLENLIALRSRILLLEDLIRVIDRKMFDIKLKEGEK